MTYRSYLKDTPCILFAAGKTPISLLHSSHTVLFNPAFCWPFEYGQPFPKPELHYLSIHLIPAFSRDKYPQNHCCKSISCTIDAKFLLFTNDIP